MARFLRLPVALWTSSSVPTRILFFLAVTLALLYGCKPSAPNAAPSEARPNKVAVFYCPGSYYITMAAAKGWFREASLNVLKVRQMNDFTNAKGLIAP